MTLYVKITELKEYSFPEGNFENFLIAGDRIIIIIILAC